MQNVNLEVYTIYKGGEIMNSKEIGERIRKIRKQKRIEVPYIAEKTGLNKATIYRYEKGEVSKIKLPIIEAIASILEVNPNWLTGLTDDMENKHTKPISLFARNLSFLLQSTNTSRLELAKELGYNSEKIIQKWENDVVEPSTDDAFIIAKRWNIPILDLCIKDLKNSNYLSIEKNSTTDSKVVTFEYSLDKYAQERNISETEIDFFKRFLDLDENTRKNMINGLTQIFNSSASSNSTSTTPHKHLNKFNFATVEEAEEAYKKMRLNSASQTTSYVTSCIGEERNSEKIK